QGIKIQGIIERLVIQLFADDTLVILRDTDSMETLYKILNVFCTASTAKFNIEKTELLPLGPLEYRKDFIQNQKLNNTDSIDENNKIINEGEAMRTLGAWIGNDTTIDPKWENILNKQQQIIQQWSKSNLSLKGKEIILKALIQSRAIFLATVNKIPKHIQEHMERIMKTFLWDGK